MLDLFSIFTKGGIVLWYFQGTALSLTPAVNALIKTVLLQVSDAHSTIIVLSLFIPPSLSPAFSLSLLSLSRSVEV